MTKRLLRHATGDLYDRKSDACDWALERLADLLRDIGFRVDKKPGKKEATLRVRLEGRNYPLLNPRFEPDALGVDTRLNAECLIVTVVSLARDHLPLDRDLRSFASSAACVFMPSDEVHGVYRYHGYFILPLRFTGERGDDIDFAALSTPLRNLLQFLQEGP